MYFILPLLLLSCTKDNIEPLGHDFEIDARLTADSAGFYHLQLSESWQTLHRISGQVSPVNNSYDLTKVYWESSHYWYIGDTLGYVVSRGLNSELQYVNYDTNYVTWFTGFEVPTTNQVSYSGEDGILNNMIAPVRSMIGDTLMLTAFWFDGSATFGIVLD